MTCMEAEKMVIPYINDQLSVTELEDFIEHIKTCENCGKSWRSTIWWMWV